MSEEDLSISKIELTEEERKLFIGKFADIDAAVNRGVILYREYLTLQAEKARYEGLYFNTLEELNKQRENSRILKEQVQILENKVNEYMNGKK
jgi:hypothetical protein